jgi:transcriptional regulator with XRE-family HTH domain
MVTELRELIQADGRSLNQLAKASGLDSGRLSRFMRGERDINFDAAARLFDALGIKFTLNRDTPPDAAPPKTAKPARKPKKK